MGPVIELAEQDSPQENLPPVAETASERRVTLGGYVETEYWNDFHGNSYFDQHRMVLFVGARIHPRITFATEIEWEHGGTPRKRDGSFIAGESLLEYVVVDFRIAEWLQARAGIVLVPVGMLNIRHDAPRWDLTVRPDVSQTIIPTTWFETGAGLFGRIPIASQELTYELYAINGLDTKIYDETGLRAARGSLGEDNNDDKALTGRVGYRPFTAVEVGVSGYRGAYDPESTRFVRIGAVDFWWCLKRGCTEKLSARVLGDA